MNEKRRSGLTITIRLLTLVKPLMKIMVVAITMGTIGFLCAIFIPILGAFALLNILNLNDSLSLRLIFTLIMMFALLRGILRYAEQAANHHIAFKLLATIRDQVFKALRRLSPAKLETKDKGNLISMITTDIELIEVFYAHTISPVVIAVLVGGIMSVYLASIHYSLGLIALLAYFSVGLFIPLLISKIGYTTGVQYRKNIGDLSTSVLDSLRGLREVTQFSYGLTIDEQLKVKTKKANISLKKIKDLEGLTTALVSSAIISFSLVVLFISINLYYENIINFEGVLIAFVSIISSFGPMTALANLSNNLLQTFAAADRILNILDEQPKTVDIVDQPVSEFGDIKLKNVKFGYDDSVIIENLNMEISQNKVIGIVGKSGSGKSTILRLLMRFWESNKGEILINDKSVNQINTTELRKMQGLLTQDTVLFNRSILDNIKIANMQATMQEVEEAAKKASIHNFILSLPEGYETVIGEQGSTLSGGERQRLGLARAFIHDAPLLLLDEPTSNLDSLNEGIILKSIDEAKKDKTVVIVSHRKHTLSIADEIIKLESDRNS